MALFTIECGRSLMCQLESVVYTKGDIQQEISRDGANWHRMLKLTPSNPDKPAKVAVAPHDGGFVSIQPAQQGGSPCCVVDPRYVVAYADATFNPMGESVLFSTPEISLQMGGCWKLEGTGIAVLTGQGDDIPIYLEEGSEPLVCDLSNVVAFYMNIKREVVCYPVDSSCGLGNFIYKVKFVGPGSVLLNTQKGIRRPGIQIDVTHTNPIGGAEGGRQNIDNHQGR